MRQNITPDNQYCRKQIIILLIILLFSAISYADTIPMLGPDKTNSINITVISDLPVIIDKPGDYFLNISKSLNETAITIKSSDVFLYGKDQSISGNRSTGTIGISINPNGIPIQNISIKNISIQNYEIGFQADFVNDCTIDSLQVNSNTRAGIQTKNCSSFLFTDCNIKNNYNDISGGIGISVIDSDRMNFEEISVYGNGKSTKLNSGGIFFSNAMNCNIIKSDILSNPGSGIQVVSGTQNLTIQESHISINSGNGIVIKDSNQPIIKYCILEKNKGTGLDLSSVLNPVIIGNSISSATIGMSISNVLQMTLSGNTLNNNRIGLDFSASDISYLKHNIDNTNFINSRPILYLYREKGKYIGPIQNPGMIIAVECSDLTISDIVLSKTGEGIILAGSNNVTISDVSFLENGIGLQTGFSCDLINLSRLHAERNLVCGYYLSDTSRLEILSLYGQDSPQGLFIKNSNNGDIRKISMSQITGTKSRMPSGLTISNSSNISIDGSIFSECSYAGIISDAKNLVLTNNSFIKNEFAGSVILSGPTKIKDNSFVQNENAGLILRSNESIIYRNSIKHNQNRGIILIQAGNNSITHNIFNNSQNIAMTLTNPGNIWNNSPEQTSGDNSNGGNYWGEPDNQGYSDLCTSDDDSGFCNKEYIINRDNIDYQPLSANYSEYSILQVSDMNNNGRPDLQDVVVLMKTISSGQKDMQYDFSGDGRVNLQDVVVLFKLISQ